MKFKFIDFEKIRFKFIDFEKTKFKFIEFEKMKFKFIDFEETKFKFVKNLRADLNSNSIQLTSHSVATHQPPLLIPYLVSQIIIIEHLKQEIFLSTVGLVLASSNLFKIFSLKKCVKKVKV